jgi:hypothetical protein
MIAVLRTCAVCLLLGAAAMLGALDARAVEPDSRAGDAGPDALPPQRLNEGQCGLFLWKRAAQPVFILVVYDQPAQARILAQGRARDLPRTSFSGEPVFGHFEHQIFSDGNVTLDLNVRFDEQRSIRDGAVVSEGVLRLGGAGGAQTIIPVGGMVACKR